MPGLLFDQQFGLLANAPVYLCALVGVGALVRRRPRIAIDLAVIVLPYGLAVAAFYMWWGGFSSPARFLTPVLLPLAIPAGCWFAASGRSGRVLGLSALALSLTMTATIALVDRGALLYNSRDGASKLLVWLSPVVDLTTGMPSLFQGTPGRGWLAALIWAGAILLVVGCVRAAPWQQSRPALALTAGLASAGAGMLGLTLVWRANNATPLTIGRSALALLGTYDVDARQLGLSLSPFERVPRADIPSRLTIADVSPAGVPAGEPALVLKDLPAAEYEIDAVMDDDAHGRLTITVDSTEGPLWTWPLAAGATTRTITVPVPLRAARRRYRSAGAPRGPSIDGQAAARAHRARTAWRRSPPQQVARYGSTIVFLLDGEAYLEKPGFWVGGRSTATFALWRDTPAPLRLFVRTPPVANQIGIDVNGSHQTVALASGAERVIDVPIAATAHGATVRITASSGAVPAHVQNRQYRSAIAGMLD